MSMNILRIHLSCSPSETIFNLLTARLQLVLHRNWKFCFFPPFSLSLCLFLRVRASFPLSRTLDIFTGFHWNVVRACKSTSNIFNLLCFSVSLSLHLYSLIYLFVFVIIRDNTCIHCSVLFSRQGIKATQIRLPNMKWSRTVWCVHFTYMKLETII